MAKDSVDMSTKDAFTSDECTIIHDALMLRLASQRRSFNASRDVGIRDAVNVAMSRTEALIARFR